MMESLWSLDVWYTKLEMLYQQYPNAQQRRHILTFVASSLVPFGVPLIFVPFCSCYTSTLNVTQRFDLCLALLQAGAPLQPWSPPVRPENYSPTKQIFITLWHHILSFSQSLEHPLVHFLFTHDVGFDDNDRYGVATHIPSCFDLLEDTTALFFLVSHGADPDLVDMPWNDSADMNELCPPQPWHKEIRVGTQLDVVNSANLWCPGEVVKTYSRGTGEVEHVDINYIGSLGKVYLPLYSRRISPLGSRQCEGQRGVGTTPWKRLWARLSPSVIADWCTDFVRAQATYEAKKDRWLSEVASSTSIIPPLISIIESYFGRLLFHT